MPSPDSYNELYVLDGGNLVLSLHEIIDTDDKKTLHPVPDWVFLIRNKKNNKNILFDIGLATVDKYAPLAQKFHIHCKSQPPSQSISEQLAKLGIAPGKIDKVIFSHAHW